jgi:hypothetical protein
MWSYNSAPPTCLHGVNTKNYEFLFMHSFHSQLHYIQCTQRRSITKEPTKYYGMVGWNDTLGLVCGWTSGE